MKITLIVFAIALMTVFFISSCSSGSGMNRIEKDIAYGPFTIRATATRSKHFFFNDTATTEIYTLALHGALPISVAVEYQCTVVDIIQERPDVTAVVAWGIVSGYGACQRGIFVGACCIIHCYGLFVDAVDGDDHHCGIAVSVYVTEGIGEGIVAVPVGVRGIGIRTVAVEYQCTVVDIIQERPYISIGGAWSRESG